jgi:hypothetical protein
MRVVLFTNRQQTASNAKENDPRRRSREPGHGFRDKEGRLLFSHRKGAAAALDLFSKRTPPGRWRRAGVSGAPGRFRPLRGWGGLRRWRGGQWERAGRLSPRSPRSGLLENPPTPASAYPQASQQMPSPPPLLPNKKFPQLPPQNGHI